MALSSETLEVFTSRPTADLWAAAKIKPCEKKILPRFGCLHAAIDAAGVSPNT
ncbi:MAG TPA: hypothetical protein VKF14_17220 [Candidatus Dormibacteraeota bacterium]|nr:hypothetical protein [Candidatus Dormibacteraeota bacterium]